MEQVLTLAEIEKYILRRLPEVLEQDPAFVTFIEGIVAEKFPRRDEFARMLDELQQQRQENRQNFEQVDKRFEQVDKRFEQVDKRFEQVDKRFDTLDERMQHFEQSMATLNQSIDQRFEQASQRMDTLEQRMDAGFDRLQSSIDRLGRRWGIRNEEVFRGTIQTLLEESFGAKVEERYLAGEQFDCVIINGDHILVEISASVGPDILKRLQRKRQLYIEETGVTPARFILATGSINSHRAEALRNAGFEVVEPEGEDY